MPWDGLQRYRASGFALSGRAIWVDLKDLTLVWADTRVPLTEDEHRTLNEQCAEEEGERWRTPEHVATHTHLQTRDARLLQYIVEREAQGRPVIEWNPEIARTLGFDRRLVGTSIEHLVAQGYVRVLMTTVPGVETRVGKPRMKCQRTLVTVKSPQTDVG